MWSLDENRCNNRSNDTSMLCQKGYLNSTTTGLDMNINMVLWKILQTNNRKKKKKKAARWPRTQNIFLGSLFIIVWYTHISCHKMTSWDACLYEVQTSTSEQKREEGSFFMATICQKRSNGNEVGIRDRVSSKRKRGSWSAWGSAGRLQVSPIWSF